MMAKEPFRIHEDYVAVDQLSDQDDATQTDRGEDEYDEQGEQTHDDDDMEREPDDENDNGNDNHESQDDGDDATSESSDDDEAIDRTVQQDMNKLQLTFPHFKNDYRLIKRIGEGNLPPTL
jgi:cell division control protein 7